MSKIQSMIITKLITAPNMFWNLGQASNEFNDVDYIFENQKSVDEFKSKHGKKAFLKASSVFLSKFLLEKKPAVNALMAELKEKESFLKRHWGRDKFNHLVFLLESFKASKEFELPELKKESGVGLLKKQGLLQHAR